MQYLRPFHSKYFALSQQIFYPFATKQKRFHNKTKVLKQQNQNAFTTKQKV